MSVLAPPLLAVASEAGGAAPIETSVPGSVIELAWLVPLLPLVGFVFLVFFGSKLATDQRQAGRFAGWVATVLVAVSFFVSLGILFEVVRQPPEARRFVVDMFTWLEVGDLTLTTDMLVDPLSITLLLVVTGVGSLVHLYSIGYMDGDAREPRYFAYLNLFVFSMLVLVLAADFVILFVGWELVGLCSYLLIGFWFEDRSNAVAAKKAFIVNRVGDVAFSVGLFLVFATFGSLAFPEVLPAAADTLAGNELTAAAIGLLLLGGAVGKSAQIPLYVWLPDAMAGPTPVSALIHAATMVTAGVYMIARASPIYVQSAAALDVVAWIGALTALLAALIAVQQDDIKKVLAYSTVSQLGYMFVGVGVGAFGAGIFHLVTHAFFKGLLFLAAGSIMHAVANRTDMWDMGGLRRHLPITFATSVVAVLAISGIPPFAGFFSKDQILASAYTHGHAAIWLLGLLTAAITAFYMTRWLIVPFFGPERFEHRIDEDVHPHESPPTMTIPLVALAVASALGGFLNVSHGGRLESWLEPAFATLGGAGEGGALSEGVLIVLSVLAGVAGIAAAVVLYRRAGDRDPLPARIGVVATAMRDTFYVDALYEWVFVRGGGAVSRALVWVDEKIIDGVVDGIGASTRRAASIVRQAQAGLVRGYVAALVMGTVVVVVAFLAGAA